MKGEYAMYNVLATSGVSGLSDFVSALGEITTVITGSAVLSAMFAGGLLVVAAKVFKRIKNAVK